MKEHPILFNGNMVRAIINGRKTQTRRVIKPQPAWIEDVGNGECVLYKHQPPDPTEQNEIKCPYGKVGDHLWVREGHRFTAIASAMRKKNNREWVTDWHIEPKLWKCLYADGSILVGGQDKSPRLTDDDTALCEFGSLWTENGPSIYMPCWASRIDLEITDVRAERVQEIGEDGAVAEGVEFRGGYWLGGTHPVKGTLKCWPTAYDAFHALWNSINARRGFGWETNPWVWVIEFKRI